MLDQFKEHNVKAIFNLQEPGEHKDWGDGIVNMNIGFSYTPEKLQANGISVYFFHWTDMTNPRVIDLLRNVKLMDMHIGKGEKVLVHCHAGQGRTALVIAAYLLYKNICTNAEDSVKYIKSKRPKWLNKEYNRKFLKDVNDEILKMRQVFPIKGEPFRYTLEDIIKHQLQLHHGPERIKYK